MSNHTAAYPIFPSLLAFDFTCLGQQIAELEQAGAAGFHFDLMDGHFVPNLTFGPMLLHALRQHTPLPFCAHLMVDAPEGYLDELARAGASRVYLHPESTPHIHRALSLAREAGMTAGVALNPGTPIAMLEPILELVDSVLIMSVNPGFGGQPFLQSTHARLRQLCALLDRLGVCPMVACDGGVDEETIRPLIEAGMTGAVVGSALFRQGNPGTTLRRLAEVAAH